MGKFFRYRLLFPALAYLPLAVAYGLAAVVGVFDLWTNRSTRRAVIAGVRLLWPQLSLWKSIKFAVGYFVTQAWECLDAYVMMRGKAGGLVRVQGIETLQQAQAEGKGVILIMAHFGRVGLHGLGLALAGFRLGMLTQAIDGGQFVESERVYIRRKAETLHAYMRGCWISLDGRLRDLYRELEKGETIIILLDAYAPGWKKHAVQLPFLGGYLALPNGILRLAKRTGARLVYGWTEPEGFRVCGFLTGLPEEPDLAFQQAVRHLEHTVQRWPWLWWLWPIVGTIWHRQQAINGGSLAYSSSADNG